MTVRGGPGTISALVLALSLPLLAGACGHAQTGHAEAPPLTIDVFDVGQGDAVLVRSPEGHAVLYDGGPDAEQVARALDALGIERLDLVIASHNHADHIGGLARVVERFRPRYFMDNGIPHTTRSYERLLLAVEASGAELLEPTARTIELGSVALRVIPPPGRASWGQNDNSVAVAVELGRFRALLAGDAEGRAWAWWLEQHPTSLRPVDLLKASHHGSRHGDVAGALDRLRPRVVVIGVGAGNPYGHPHDGALELYRRAGARILRTDRDGSVRIEAWATGEMRVTHPHPHP